MGTFVAWHMNGQGWFFIKPEEMNRCEKSYTVTRTQAYAIGRRLESLIID